MSSFAKSFADEIRRLARKEIRAATQELQDANRKLKKTNSDLIRRLSNLERQIKQVASLQKSKGSAKPGKVSADEVLEEKVRITAKGIRSLRAKWKMSQTDFARVLGVSAQSVVNWEAKEGAISLRERPRKAYISLRGLGAREARKLLENGEGASDS